jgi:hypothetical protein
MATDAKFEEGGPENVVRVFYILNGKVSIGDTEIPLASPQVELRSTGQRRIVCFTMTDEQTTRFQEAWQRTIHSMGQAGGQYLVSDFDPSATPDVRYSTEVRYSSSVDFCDVKYRSVTYAVLRSGGATRVDEECVDVTYATASRREVTYLAAHGRRLIEERPIQGGTRIPLTIRGDSRQGNRRLIVEVDGIDEARVRPSLAGPKLVDVMLQLTTTLPIEKVIWLIESE